MVIIGEPFDFFLKLCMKLEVHKGEKVSEPDFGGKFLFCQKLGKNGTKMDLLYIFQIPVPCDGGKSLFNLF